MKFVQSAIVIAALFASTEAIKLTGCNGPTCEEKLEAHRIKKENKHIEKVVGEAMAKFVAKHEELEERRANQARTDQKLRETEEKEDKAAAAKKQKDEAKEVKKVVEDAEKKLEHDEEEADKKDKINKQKED